MKWTFLQLEKEGGLPHTAELMDWIDAFSRNTQTNWNVKQTHSRLKIMQRKDFACHLGHFRKRPGSTPKSGRKNFGCPATITVKIKQINSMSRRRYSYVREGRPAMIIINFNHNHPITNVKELSLRRLDSRTRDMFFTYFEQGMSARVAAEHHQNKNVLNGEAGDDDFTRSDASVNPSKRTISHLHDQWRKTNPGDHNGDRIWNLLEQKIMSYESEGSLVVIQKQPTTVAILTPIMQRAHSLAMAAEVAYVDSTACCNAESHTITFILVRSAYGAVPAGVVITAGQSESDYKSVFSTLKTMLGDKGFGGQGQPGVFVTDDCTAERNALNAVWPKSLQSLCRFHVMQSLWRWLCKRKYKIAKEDLTTLLHRFRNVLYSVSEEDAEMKLMELKSASPTYSSFVCHVERLWKDRDLWCTAWHKIPALRDNHTNKYAELTVHLFREHILSRCKDYSLVTLVDFVVNVMENFYRNQLERFSSGNVSMHQLLLEKLQSSNNCIDSPEAIAVVNLPSGTMYIFPGASSILTYEVDPVLGVCSCGQFVDGSFCKHLVAVYKFFNESLQSIPAITAEARHEAARLALGEKASLPPLFHQNLTADVVNSVDSADTNSQHQIFSTQTCREAAHLVLGEKSPPPVFHHDLTADAVNSVDSTDTNSQQEIFSTRTSVVANLAIAEKAPLPLFHHKLTAHRVNSMDLGDTSSQQEIFSTQTCREASHLALGEEATLPLFIQVSTVDIVNTADSMNTNSHQEIFSTQPCCEASHLVLGEEATLPLFVQDLTVDNIVNSVDSLDTNSQQEIFSTQTCREAAYQIRQDLTAGIINSVDTSSQEEIFSGAQHIKHERDERLQSSPSTAAVSDKWEEFSLKLKDLIWEHRMDLNCDDMLLDIDSARTKLENIKTAAQLMSFVHSLWMC